LTKVYSITGADKKGRGMNRRELERVTPESVGISSQSILDLLDYLETEENNCEPHGLVIMRHGKICTEGWWAPYAPSISHELFSMSKTYSATGLGIAYTEGLLDIDDPIVKYFLEYVHLCNDARSIDIRIRDILAMSSGKKLERTDVADWVPHYFMTGMAGDPGSHFAYNAEDTHMCVALVEKVTGMRFEDYLGERLFDKIGIDKSNVHWGHLLNGSVIGCGGLSATTEDSLRLIKLYLDDGVWDGERILAHDYVCLATSRQAIPVGDVIRRSISNPYREEGVEEGYGFQIWLNPGNIGGCFEAAGGLGQFAAAIPEKKLAVSFHQSSERNGIDEGIAKYAVLGRLKAAARDEPLPENPSVYAKLQRRLARLTLGNPRSQPHSLLAPMVSGQRYIVQGDSSLTFRKPLWKHMVLCDPIVYMDGMKWFSFDFSGVGTCRLTFFEMDMVREITVGLDGMRRLNDYGHDRIPGVSKALFDGFWLREDVFRVNARWIQTCYSIGIDFYFHGSEVHITAAYIHGDLSEHPMRITDYDAVRA